jgi:hypothetical protein
MSRLLPVVWLIVLASSLGQTNSCAADEMDKELFEVAKEVSAFLKRYGTSTIAVGQFTSPPQLNSSAGPAIAKTLAEELTECGIDIKRLSDLGIKGEYRLVTQEGAGGPEARIKGYVETLEGKQLYSFSRHLRNTATLTAIFGLTVELPASEGEEDRKKRIVASIMQPQTQLKDARISAGKDSPYGVEILVKSGDEYRPRRPVEKERLAFVKIDRDEAYAVVLINDSDQDAAVTLTIDGLNMIAFSEFRE